MPVQQLPLMKGVGKDFRNADYIDYLPVNMLAVPKEVLNSNGYLRSFPGIVKTADVDGSSMGAIYNANQGAVYRVMGRKLYRGDAVVSELSVTGRVSMAYSYKSHAVGTNGTYTLFRYSGEVKALSNWPVDSGYVQYDLGYLRDMCRNRSRYIWAKEGTDSFFISDLEDESKPDRYSAEYRAESQPDGIIGIDNWRDYVVCFGTSTIEYFDLTGNASAPGVALYQTQPSMMVQKGIAGTYCKTKFADTHAFISNPATGAPSIYIINSGAAVKIATSTVEKILQSHTSDELSQGVMEVIRFEGHELLLVHLNRCVLVYDAAVTTAGQQWSILKSGLDDDVYSAIDLVYEGNRITCGDKTRPLKGQLNTAISSQYGEHQEHLLFTPLFKADNARVFDFELESSTGVEQIAERMFISATTDGIMYGREQMIPWNAPFRYDKRAIWKRIGRIRKNLGFKIRIVTSSPVTLSGCQVRIE